MFLVSTRNFPPDIGGIQNLMEGLSNALLNHGPVKVFADKFENCENYDENSKLSIQRIAGFKIFKEAVKFARGENFKYMAVTSVEKHPNSQKNKRLYKKLGFEKDSTTFIATL